MGEGVQVPLGLSLLILTSLGSKNEIMPPAVKIKIKYLSQFLK